MNSKIITIAIIAALGVAAAIFGKKYLTKITEQITAKLAEAENEAGK